MAVVILDASVVIGFLDSRDALHRASVAAVTEHQHDDLVIPASVYAEILVGPYRAGPDAVAEVDAFLADLAVTIAPLAPACAQIAARLRSDHRSLRLPDALVLATAEDMSADVIITGDASWKRITRLATVLEAD